MAFFSTSRFQRSSRIKSHPASLFYGAGFLLLVLAGTAVMTSLSVAKGSKTSKKVLEVKDVDGGKHTLPDKKSRATVLFFIAVECPISNSYAPEINRISTAYRSQGIASRVVYAEPGLTAAQAKQHAQEYGYQCPALLDSSHALVRKTRVTVTPEAAVLAPNGKVLYRGRIDDRHIDFGKKRSQPKQRDLRLALEAIIQGKPVPHPTTKAIGCFIPTED